MQRIDPSQFSEADFPSELEIRIDWSEIDVLGHVNNVMINKYFQAARIQLWGNIKIDTSFSNLKVEPMVASTSVQFFKPLYFPGNIKVKTRVKNISNSSYILEHILIDDTDDIAAMETDVIVNYDFEAMKSKPIGEELRESLGNFQTP